ncbi:MAG: hypothetical protein M3Q65_03840 [Chloroflexota bacterium]|nr:hypothetical protein [Chloroflexota bacterium]
MAREEQTEPKGEYGGDTGKAAQKGQGAQAEKAKAAAPRHAADRHINPRGEE